MLPKFCPQRPKPQMITCLLALMDLRAIEVICKDCCSHSLDTSFITMVLLYKMMKGVASIDSTMLARMGFNKLGGTKLFSLARLSSTKPNSPACARYRPHRNDVPAAAPNTRARAVIITSLKITGSVASSSTSGQRSSTICQSSSMPILMKNSPSSTS